MADSGSRSWCELSLETGLEAADAVAEVFSRHGLNEVAIEHLITPGRDEGAHKSGFVRLVAYLPSDGVTEGRRESIEESLWHLRAFNLAPISALRQRTVQEEDWAAAWKEHFEPLRIGRRVVIKPTWRDFAAGEGDVVVELDPGMAFGTGLHPTTRLMIETLEERLRPGMRVVDVGTGSGILAIAAAKLGAAHVDAGDIDATACRVARENVRLNRVDDVVNVYSGTLDTGEPVYELALANITAAVLVQLSGDIARRVKPDGYLALSGIIVHNRDVVHSALARLDLNVEEERQDGDWMCLIVRR
ncbi:MAG TPA: 50S ribosomal protein L11 methyltransferase [Chloroflexota bacterium]|nr:50S ribosomal protein L11 methyltransferase [Chloroflexota bacterium]